MDAADTFRWQALFQHTTEPVFVLNRRRRLLFANRACEALTGRPLADLHGMACTRRNGDHSLAPLARALCPPPEVMGGKSARLQRPEPGASTGPPWWEIEFLPLSGADGVIGVLGKIVAGPRQPATVGPQLTATWVALRRQAAEHYRLDMLDATRQPTVVAQARLAAASRCPVLIVGQPGTGKRWLARAIHHASERRSLQFVALDCTHLPPAALRAVLTGTMGLGRPDRVGTVYLHEPSGLPRELQADVVQRLADETDTGPRVIAGTTAADDPKQHVFLGRMLPELYDVLAILVIPLPPLRTRKDEVSRLVDAMLKRAAPLFGKSLRGLSPQAWDCIRTYPWPGNLRELYAILLKAGRRATTDQIDMVDFPLAVQQASAATDAPAARPPAESPPLDKVLEEVERRMIRLALDQARGNKSKAAELLGVWRPRLLGRIKALGLDEQ